MGQYEYTRAPISLIQEDIIKQYNIIPLVENVWVYLNIRKGMYGLPQAGLLANQLLIKHLYKYGYHPTKQNPGLWKHEKLPVTFSLVVDDFRVNYIGRKHDEHIIYDLKDL